jgi:hypothetical protein
LVRWPMQLQGCQGTSFSLETLTTPHAHMLRLDLEEVSSVGCAYVVIDAD